MQKVNLLPDTPSPDFMATDVYGKPVNLKKQRSKFVLVAFFRYAACPWCNLAIHRLTIEYPLLKESDCEVVAFIQSDKDSIKRNIYGRHDKTPPFPIIADPDMEVYKKFGVEKSFTGTAKHITKFPYWLKSVRKYGFKQTEVDGSLFLVPATFLVHLPSGNIAHADYNASYYEDETFSPIYEQLQFYIPSK